MRKQEKEVFEYFKKNAQDWKKKANSNLNNHLELGRYDDADM